MGNFRRFFHHYGVGQHTTQHVCKTMIPSTPTPIVIAIYPDNTRLLRHVPLPICPVVNKVPFPAAAELVVVVSMYSVAPTYPA